ncbi:hypothetical protein WBJ53_09715 [Spirosoma sp. SC4-14]|uniref:hypothetical protein n=1 Tax=Spirosoma sp. SC4-14 TaxID=3128900 RepID=UPI0030CCAA8F
MKNSYLISAALGVTGLLIAGLILINPNHFTSIDSGYYLQSATSLLTGQGYRFQEDRHLVWNGVFPIGYSALIALLSALTGVSVLIASKLVNYLALCFSAWLWVRRLSINRSFWLLSVWWLGSFLKILAYTWSETLFLILLAEWVWQLHLFLEQPSGGRSGLLWGKGYLLFLIRYMGGYTFGLLGCLGLLIWISPKWLRNWPDISTSRTIYGRLLVISCLGIAGMGFYFWLNYRLSDSMYGGERFFLTSSVHELSWLFGRALLNEWLLIRDFLPNESNQLAWLGMIIQLVLFAIFYERFSNKIRALTSLTSIPPVSRLFFLTGVTYLLVLFSIRIVSPYAGPNLRLMAPFTFCILAAGLIWIGSQSIIWQRFIRPYWIVLLLCSWLQLLPQVDFNRKLERIRAKLLAESTDFQRLHFDQRYNYLLWPHNQPFTLFPDGAEPSTPTGMTGLIKKFRTGMVFRLSD